MEPTPTKANQESRPRPAEILSPRVVERVAAVLIILYAIALVLTVVTRVGSGADQETALESLTMIAANAELYMASKIANLISAFVLVVLAAVSYRIFQRYDRTLALVGAVTLLSAGLLWTFSSVAGLALAQEYGGPLPSQAPLVRAGSILGTYNAVEPLRALAGQAGFTFAALALLALGSLIAWSGTLPRWLGWLGIVAGVLMFFIWNPEATALHRIGGGAYLLWLLLLAGWLLFRGTYAATAGDIDAETGEH